MANYSNLPGTQDFLGWSKLNPLLVTQSSQCLGMGRGLHCHYWEENSNQSLHTWDKTGIWTELWFPAINPLGTHSTTILLRKMDDPWVLMCRWTPQPFHISGEFSLFHLGKSVGFFFRTELKLEALFRPKLNVLICTSMAAVLFHPGLLPQHPWQW